MRVVVNAAMSADGKLSTREREQLHISDDADLQRVDRLRAESDAVMVGVGTVFADDPSLTVDDPALRTNRESGGRPPNPARVVADSRARTPSDATVLDDTATSYLLVTTAAPDEAVAEARSAGVTVLVHGEGQVDLAAALHELESRGVDQLMVEGGGELIASLFDASLVDDLRVFVGSLVIGGRDAPTLVDGEGFVAAFPGLALRSVEQLGDGVLLAYDVP